MRMILKLEELAMLFLSILAFALLDYNWWWFAGLFFVPDIGMLGYLVNNRVGAFAYNLFHHKAVAVALGLLGYFMEIEILEITGIVLFAHSSFDRVLGYGLKFEKGFKFTHLGEIGN